MAGSALGPAPLPGRGPQAAHSVECVICLDAPRSTRFEPCGHAVCCRSCAQLLTTQRQPCPTCRADIARTVDASPGQPTFLPDRSPPQVCCVCKLKKRQCFLGFQVPTSPNPVPPPRRLLSLTSSLFPSPTQSHAEGHPMLLWSLLWNEVYVLENKRVKRAHQVDASVEVLRLHDPPLLCHTLRYVRLAPWSQPLLGPILPPSRKRYPIPPPSRKRYATHVCISSIWEGRRNAACHRCG